MDEAGFEDEGEVSAISLAEVTEVVGKLLRGRASGVGEIHPEMRKAVDIDGLSWLTRFFCDTWRSGTVTLECQTRVVVVRIFKKEDWSVCSYYWVITLLSQLGKLMPGCWTEDSN